MSACVDDSRVIKLSSSLASENPKKSEYDKITLPVLDSKESVASASEEPVNGSTVCVVITS